MIHWAFLNLWWWAIVVFLVICLLLLKLIQRKYIWQKITKEEQLEKLLFAKVNFKNIIAKKVIIIVVFLLSVISLLGPQWGKYVKKEEFYGRDILILLDISQSMLAEDIKPSRLKRAKLALQDLTIKLNQDRLGLILFAGEAFELCPLTEDYHGFLLSLESANPQMISLQGTNFQNALELAWKVFNRSAAGKERAVIIISDGEDHQGDLENILQKFKEENIKIFTIGVGTEQGDLIPVVSNSTREYLRDKQGKLVVTKLQPYILKKIASQTKGKYIQANQINFGLQELYYNYINKLSKTKLAEKEQEDYYHRFHWFLFSAILLLLLEMKISEIKVDNEKGSYF